MKCPYGFIRCPLLRHGRICCDTAFCVGHPGISLSPSNIWHTLQI